MKCGDWFFEENECGYRTAALANDTFEKLSSDDFDEVRFFYELDLTETVFV